MGTVAVVVVGASVVGAAVVGAVVVVGAAVVIPWVVVVLVVVGWPGRHGDWGVFSRIRQGSLDSPSWGFGL